MSAPWRAPEGLDATHECAAFDSGEPVLDDWLKRRALENARLGATRAYVVCPACSRRVVGFYALAMGAIVGRDALGSMRRNTAPLIPAVVLARLAVDRSARRGGLGAALLLDAVERSRRAAREIGARLVVVHALSPAAEAFYVRHGFRRLPIEQPTLALDLAKFDARG